MITAVGNTETGLATISEQSRVAAVYDRVEPMAFIETMGKAFSQSGAGGCKNIADGQVMALACLCEGKTIFEIARRYHLIEGKLGLKSESMLADFRQMGGKHEWLKDGIDGIEASIKLTGHDGQVIVCSMTIDRAKAAGYVKPNSNWQKRPDQMLRARCITDGIRMGWPEIAGDYSVEELEDGFTGPAGPAAKSEPKSTAAKSSVAKVVDAKPAMPVIEPTKVVEQVKPVEKTDETVIDVEPEKKPEVAAEVAPFDTATTTATSNEPVKGDADESTIPTAADATFTAVVLEIQTLIAGCGWVEADILAKYNANFRTNCADFGEFDDDKLEIILNNIRKVHEKHQAKLLAAK